MYFDRGGADGVDVASLRELRLLRDIDHPRIVAMRDVFFHEGQLHIAYDRCECDLEVLLLADDARLRLSHVKRYMHDLLSALDYLHDRSIVHRVRYPLFSFT